MVLRNCRGERVDPVPFLVVTGIAFMMLLSFGPLYGQALGVSLEMSIIVSFALFCVVSAAAYYWQVWTARSDGVPVPANVRGVRLFYLMAVLAGLGIVLALPFLR